MDKVLHTLAVVQSPYCTLTSSASTVSLGVVVGVTLYVVGYLSCCVDSSFYTIVEVCVKRSVLLREGRLSTPTVECEV